MGTRLEQTLLQRAQKPMKRGSASLAIIEMQVKTTMKYHLTLVRMAIINKSTNNKCWQGCGERGILVHCCWECRLVQPLWKAVWSYLKQLKMDLSFDPGIPLLGIYPKEARKTKSNEYMQPYVHCSVIYNSQDLEAA